MVDGSEADTAGVTGLKAEGAAATTPVATALGLAPNGAELGFDATTTGMRRIETGNSDPGLRSNRVVATRTGGTVAGEEAGAVAVTGVEGGVTG